MPTREMSSGAPHRMEWRQALGNEGRVLQTRDADRKIEAFLHQIDKTVIQPHIEHNVRMGEAKVDQRLPNDGIGKSARGRQFDTPARIRTGFADSILQRVDLANDLHRSVIIGVTGFGQRKLPRGTVEKACTEFVLQFPHIFGKKRLGTSDFSRSGGKAFRLDHVDEGAHTCECVHGLAPLPDDVFGQPDQRPVAAAWSDEGNPERCALHLSQR